MGGVLWLLSLPCSYFLLVPEWPQIARFMPWRDGWGHGSSRGSETEDSSVERCPSREAELPCQVPVGLLCVVCSCRVASCLLLFTWAMTAYCSSHLLWLFWQATSAACRVREGRQMWEAWATFLLNWQEVHCDCHLTYGCQILLQWLGVLENISKLLRI